MSIDVDLSGKTVLLTGVSSGLGRHLARAYVSAGATVVGTARRAQLGEELESELTGSAGSFTFVQGDVSKVAECKRLVDRVVSLHGGVDVLVNNAAVRTDPALMPLDEVDENNFDRVLDTNLKSAFFLTKFVSAPMRGNGSGVILNIASHTAEQATAGMSAYVVSKAGLVQLTRVTAVEYLGHGIRANVILLGGTATGQQDRTAAALRAERVEPEAVSASVDPKRWLNDPGAVAKAILALSDEDCSVITGASIAIDQAATAGSYTSAFTHQLIAASRQA